MRTRIWVPFASSHPPSLSPTGSARWSRWPFRDWTSVGGFGLLLLSATPAMGAQEPQAVEVRIPHSVQDHLELAGLYQRVVVEERDRASALRRSLAEELQRACLFPNKTGRELPRVTRVREEFGRQIANADRAAGEAEHLADYHRMRAKELEGHELALLRHRLSIK